MKEFLSTLKKYNFWNNQKIELGLSRTEYLQKLKYFLGNRLIKVLTGQRRSGKSFLMRQLIFHLQSEGVHPNNILYINKEFAGFEFIRNSNDLNECIKLYLTELKPEGKVYLFFDEVHLINKWETVINSYSQDYTKEYEIIISGSNASILSGELSSLLSGRYISFEIFPFSFAEYCLTTGKNQDKSAFLGYLTSGSMPELFNLPMTETRVHYVQDLKNTIVLKDIVMRHKIKDVGLLESLFAYLVQNIANPVSLPNLVNYLKNAQVATNFNTLSNYIEFLKQTYVIHEVPRFDMKGKKILSGVKKYYLNDLAFRNYLFSSFEPGLGYLLENFVFLELRRNGYTVFTGSDQNREVDFVAVKNGITRYIQVCYLITGEDVVKREFGNLETIKDNYEKMVISMDDVSLGNRNGIIHAVAWNTKIYK
ncbi:MAG: ATP-binding protein [Draconibacterium sp.]